MWDSIDWLQKAPNTIKKGTKITWKEDAYIQLSNTLNRARWNPTPAIERGISFEKQICHGTKPVVAKDLIEKFDKAYSIIHAEGVSFQEKAKKTVEAGGRKYLLYGKMDVLTSESNLTKVEKAKPHEPIKDLITDIKTTGNYRGGGSYLEKWQHKVYCLCTEIPDFLFIVYEFNNKTGLLVDIHFIDYHVDDFVALEKEVMAKLDSVREFLNSDPKLKKAYLTKFNMYN